MALQVELYRFAIHVGSQLAAKHMQDPASFWISAVAKLLIWVLIFSLHDWQHIVGHVDELACVLPELIEHGVPAMFLFFEQMRVVGGKSLVQPDVGPILAGDQIAKP